MFTTTRTSGIPRPKWIHFTLRNLCYLLNCKTKNENRKIAEEQFISEKGKGAHFPTEKNSMVYSPTTYLLRIYIKEALSLAWHMYTYHKREGKQRKSKSC